MSEGHIRRGRVFALLVLAWSHLGGAHTDGTLGPQRSFSGHFTVPANVGQQRGGNLFHSFSDLGLAAGESATFADPTSVRNVIVRVTGGTASTIDGTLGCSIPGADIYFLNPAGVAFGPGASLDVKGSFAVSTADYVRLADGSRFASATANPTLRSATAEAFGFLGGQNAEVSAVGKNSFRIYSAAPLVIGFKERSVLKVPAGHLLSVVAADVGIVGTTLRASGGTVRIQAVGQSAGEWPVLSTGDSRTTTPLGGGGTVGLRQAASLDASGTAAGHVSLIGEHVAALRSFITDNTVARASGGISIVAGGGLALPAYDSVTANTSGTGRGGEITLTAGTDLDLKFNDTVSANTSAGGHSGNVNLSAGKNICINASFVSSLTQGPGQGGSVNLSASRGIRLSRGSAVNAVAYDVGPSGSVALHAGSVLLDDFSSLLTATLGGGKGGNISVDTRDGMKLVDGSFITARTFGSAPAGNVVVKVRGTLALSGGSDVDSDTFATGPAAGHGGEVIVDAGAVRLSGPGDLEFTSIGAASTNLGGGDRLDGGAAGSVVVRSKTSVDLSGSSRIFVDSTKSPGGNLMVTAGTAIQLYDGVISAKSNGDGASATLSAQQAVTLSGRSTLSTQSRGNGGDITVDAPTLALGPRSIVNASGGVNGGNIAIDAGFLPGVRVRVAADPLPSDNVIATGTTGRSGSISVAPTRTEVPEGIVRLPVTLLGSEVRLQPRCGESSNVSSFLVTGYGGLSLDPQSWQWDEPSRP